MSAFWYKSVRPTTRSRRQTMKTTRKTEIVSKEKATESISNDERVTSNPYKQPTKKITSNIYIYIYR